MGKRFCQWFRKDISSQNRLHEIKTDIETRRIPHWNRVLSRCITLVAYANDGYSLYGLNAVEYIPWDMIVQYANNLVASLKTKYGDDYFQVVI
jgi:hypothetical protein